MTGDIFIHYDTLHAVLGFDYRGCYTLNLAFIRPSGSIDEVLQAISDCSTECDLICRFRLANEKHMAGGVQLIQGQL